MSEHGTGSAVLDPWRLALGTLTRLPVRAPARVDGAVAGRAMLLAPVAALVPAAGVSAVVGLGTVVPAPLLLAGCALVWLAVVTGAIHLDGLADTADAVAVPGDRQRALAVMRRGDTGPVGAAALVLVLLVDAAGLAVLAGAERGWLVAGAVVVLSRLALPWACLRGGTAARAEGLGAAVAGTVSLTAAVLLTAAVVAGGVGAAVLGGLPWWLPVLAAAGAAAPVGVLLHWARRRLGGITGDVLGAAVEVALAGGLVAAALVLAR